MGERATGLRFRARALLVLSLLAGVLAMHGLTAGSASPSPAAAPALAHHAVTMTAAATMDGPRAVCPGDDGMPAHSGHADQLCVSGAVPGAPHLPALAPAVTSQAVAPPHGPLPGTPSGPPDGRAPPGLAELQLLRI